METPGELDAGPIIEQDTVRIDRGDTVEARVLISGNKPIVFK